MRYEIERKFLVRDDSWRGRDEGVRLRQGYLSVDPERTVRVRLVGDRGWLTIKGASVGSVRPEFEYAIPAAEAASMLEHLCLRPQIEKIRYRIEHAGLLWEVDEFLGENAGLVLAEIELADPRQPVTLPPWIGEEVTDDHRYSNAWLSRHPFRHWGADPN
ncbi:CYTH domain-containing protein [Geothermobacter ehrlichii]